MGEDIDRCWSKGTDVQLDRRNNPADMYILKTIFLKTASKVDFVFLSKNIQSNTFIISLNHPIIFKNILYLINVYKFLFANKN